jgi:endonuclease/exonuclease/phosphatase family metal-dependent hydrolase
VQGQVAHPLARRILVVLAIGVLTLCTLRFASCGHGVRVGTFNIRQFGFEPTDMDRLTAVIQATEADVLALQEIRSDDKMKDLARRLSVKGRRYAFQLSTCGGTSKMRVGLLYDEARVAVRDFREYPELDPDGKGACSTKERPGFAATIDDGRRPFTVLVIHLVSGSEPAQIARRRVQWQLAHRIAKDLGAGGVPVMILGDTNSTGFLDDKAGERTFIEDEAKKAEMDVVTGGLGCSEYWSATTGGPLQPSLLDHVVASPGLAARGTVRVHGFCEQLACAPAQRAPEDYVKVSDHCPVTLDLQR